MLYESSERPAVLVVDDDVDSVEAISEVLDAQGFDVGQAHNGAQAIDLLERSAPNFILLDLAMPVMNGYQLAQRVRERPEWARIPVIVVSAEPDLSAKARALGAHGYLTKPFDFGKFQKMMQYLLPGAAIH